MADAEERLIPPAHTLLGALANALFPAAEEHPVGPSFQLDRVPLEAALRGRHDDQQKGRDEHHRARRFPFAAPEQIDEHDRREGFDGRGQGEAGPRPTPVPVPEEHQATEDQYEQPEVRLAEGEHVGDEEEADRGRDGAQPERNDRRPGDQSHAQFDGENALSYQR